MTTVTVELDVTATGRYVPEVPAQIQGDPNDCYPGEAAHVEDLRVTIRVPLSKLGTVRPDGTLDVDITHLLTENQKTVCEDQMVSDAEEGS